MVLMDFHNIEARSTPSQTDEYEITSTSSVSVSLSVTDKGLNGQQLSASADLLEWPVLYLMIKLSNASSLSHQTCNAANLLSWT